MSEGRRCPICDWPMAATAKEGCVTGNCSYRPDNPDEQRRIAERRRRIDCQVVACSTYPEGCGQPIGFYTNAPTGVPGQPVTVESLIAVIRPMEERRKKINADMARALGDLIAQSREPITVWASLLAVPVPELYEVLDGRREPDGNFWDQVKRVFDPARHGGNPWRDKLKPIVSPFGQADTPFIVEGP